MSENWQIALVSAILTIMTGVLGLIAGTLAGIRKDISRKVDKDDCVRDMDRHCSRLDKLDRDVQENTRDIEVLKNGMCRNPGGCSTCRRDS